MRECTIEGERRDELVAATVAFARRELMPADMARLVRVDVFDATVEDAMLAVFEPNDVVLGIDVRSVRGQLVVNRGPYVDYFCIDVHEHDTIDIALDYYTGLTP
jgi:hypothetical protein